MFDHFTTATSIASKDQVAVSKKIIQQLETGVEVDSSYKGPQLQYSAEPLICPKTGDILRKKKCIITQSFIDEMIEYFKDGKCIHRRFAWEIVLGAFHELQHESALAETTIPEGESCVV